MAQAMVVCVIIMVNYNLVFTETSLTTGKAHQLGCPKIVLD